MKDLDPVNARRFVSDKISDIYSWGQLLKPFGLVWIAFGLNENIYFTRIYLEVIEDRFPGACHLLNRYNMLLKHLIQGPPVQ